VLIAEILNNFGKCTGTAADPITVYCYKTELPSKLKHRPNIFIYKGLPNLKNIRLQFARNNYPLVIVFDDLLSGKLI